MILKMKFIDLFAGMGGLRLGFENAASKLGIETRCVATSEIKPHALRVLEENFEHEKIIGDITQVEASELPDFDYLLAGIPCQAFSFSGKRRGFADTRGTLFFDVLRIIKEKQPTGIIIENVEGLIKHDFDPTFDENIGRTLSTMLRLLKEEGYQVSWELLNSKDFSVAQERKRIFIVAHKNTKIDIHNYKVKNVILKDILQENLRGEDTEFTRKLLKYYKPEDLEGKSIKDKRGGPNNIHSWDFDLRGETTESQKELMNLLFKERRKKKWAKLKGIEWMDGMPLTLDEVSTFFNKNNLKDLLDDLVEKKYLRYEHPKDIFVEDNIRIRKYREDLPKGYNIVAGKLSFEYSNILDKNRVTPTLVATDINRIGIVDNNNLRKLTDIECRRLFGYPDTYKMPVKEQQKYDLFGNTVVISVVEFVASRLLNEVAYNNNEIKTDNQLIFNI